MKPASTKKKLAPKPNIKKHPHFAPKPQPKRAIPQTAADKAELAKLNKILNMLKEIGRKRRTGKP